MTTEKTAAAFLKLVKSGRVARRVEELDDETLQAIARGTVPSEHAAPDSLLKDWNPTLPDLGAGAVPTI